MRDTGIEKQYKAESRRALGRSSAFFAPGKTLLRENAARPALLSRAAREMCWQIGEKCIILRAEMVQKVGTAWNRSRESEFQCAIW